MRRLLTVLAALPLASALLGAVPAHASPVCTDGYNGGPMLVECGGRIFPEAALAHAYVQYAPEPLTGFREYQDGIAFMAQKYPRWVSVSTLAELTGNPLAVSAGPDGIRSTDEDDTGDGRAIPVIRLTDHQAPPPGKQHLFFSLSVHGNERGGLEGGLRAIEDLAMAAEGGGTIVDGVKGYPTSTGRLPVFHEYEVKDVLAKEDVWFVDFNIDGWEVGDVNTVPTAPYERENSEGTDLNRQMPTIGRINSLRNPLQESEMRWGTELMDEIAASGVGGKLAYGADIHGELTSRAYVDIMYPAGQFDSVKHRRLMAIAERTKSVIDATLYEGIQDQVEDQSGGDTGEGVEGPVCDFVPDPEMCRDQIRNSIPTKPAHWATVWDTLGYTDTGFIGDYLAADLGVTGMDYEIFLNHTVPDKEWNVYLQENHINASRAIVKTAMAYALYQEEEFNDANFSIDPAGRPGYVFNPEVVTDTDANGPGTKPGPDGDGLGADGEPVRQAHYRATNMTFFTEEGRLLTRPFEKVLAEDVARDPKALDRLDTLVLADITAPKGTYDKAAYFRNIGSWVRRGGNLVLTDRAVYALAKLGVVEDDAILDILVYQPYTDIVPGTEHPLVRGLRANARQLVEATLVGYGIGASASPMTAVDETAFTAAGGTVVGTSGDGRVTLGEVEVGGGIVRVIGGALPMPTEEEDDHRFGLKDYAMTYSGLYVMENAIRWDAPGLGIERGTGSGGGGTGGTGGTGGSGGPIASTGANESLALAAAGGGGRGGVARPTPSPPRSLKITTLKRVSLRFRERAARAERRTG